MKHPAPFLVVLALLAVAPACGGNGSADLLSAAVASSTAATRSTPSRSGTVPAATTTAAGSPTAQPTTTAAAGGTYTVVAGDTPLAIAQKQGVPEEQRGAWIQQLLSLNATTATALQIGQVLKLPASPTGAAPAGATPQTTATARAGTPSAQQSPSAQSPVARSPVPQTPAQQAPAQPAAAGPQTAAAISLESVTSSVAGGGTASLRARTPPGTVCSLSYTSPSGAESTAAGLGPKTADTSGSVSWSWQVATERGIGGARLLCAGETINVSIQTT